MDDLIRLLGLAGIVVLLFVIGGILVGARVGERGKFLVKDD